MKNSLSYTAVEMYLQSPKAYFFHYICGLREKVTGSALIFGNAMDAALNAMLVPKDGKNYKEVYHEAMTQQMINGVIEDLALTANVRYSNSDFDKNVLTEEDLKQLEQVFKKDPLELYETLLERKKYKIITPAELKVFNSLSYKSLYNKGLLMLEAYETQVKPRIKKVLEVQKFVRLDNDTGDEFIGYVDLVCEWEDGRIIIFDNKTTSVKYEDGSVKESKQLATYIIALEEKYNTRYTGYIAIPKKIRSKKLPRVEIQIIIDQVDEKVIDETFETYDNVNQAIKRGEFPCNPEGCCNVYGQCKFYKLCHEGSMEGLIDVSKPRASEDRKK